MRDPYEEVVFHINRLFGIDSTKAYQFLKEYAIDTEPRIKGSNYAYLEPDDDYNTIAQLQEKYNIPDIMNAMLSFDNTYYDGVKLVWTVKETTEENARRIFREMKRKGFKND